MIWEIWMMRDQPLFWELTPWLSWLLLLISELRISRMSWLPLLLERSSSKLPERMISLLSSPDRLEILRLFLPSMKLSMFLISSLKIQILMQLSSRRNNQKLRELFPSSNPPNHSRPLLRCPLVLIDPSSRLLLRNFTLSRTLSSSENSKTKNKNPLQLKDTLSWSLKSTISETKRLSVSLRPNLIETRTRLNLTKPNPERNNLKPLSLKPLASLKPTNISELKLKLSSTRNSF